MISKVPAQNVQCEAEPANDRTDVAGVNMFPYLGSWVVHPPRRLSVLQKRVIGTDGKLLKCPEGSSSSVLLKKGRSVRYLTHRCLESSKLPSGFPVLLCLNRCLGLYVEVSTPYGVQVFKIGKWVPMSKEVEFSSWHTSPCRPCKLRLWPLFVSELLSLIIFSGHWILAFLLCRVLTVQCFFGTDTP